MRSSGATARSARAASAAAPSPSSGATAAAAAVAASASSSTCRSRSRRARSSCSSPGSIPSVASTSAWSSASRDATASAFARQLVEPAARGDELAPRRSCVAAALELLGAAERVEDVELERRTREPALLELAGHRDEPLGRRRRRPRAPRLAPTRTRASGRPRRHVARSRARARPRAAAPRAQPAPRRRRSRRARRARPRRTPRSPSEPTDDASARAPSSSPIAWAKIVLPAPVSPVTAFSPGANDSSASRMRTRFSIRSLRSMQRDSSRPPTALRSRRVRPAVRDLAIVLAVSWLARALFIAAIGDAQSNDVGHWVGALDVLDEGRNPYETGVLNWPPLWLVVIAGLDTVANNLNLSFWSVLRVYLVARRIRARRGALPHARLRRGRARARVPSAARRDRAQPDRDPSRLPAREQRRAGRSARDARPLAALIAFERSRDVVFWLLGCLVLGLGVLAKTVPLVLAPILAPGARLASRAGRALGVGLLLGPAALGMAVILALAPVPVIDHVIRYRSTRGFFAIRRRARRELLRLQRRRMTPAQHRCGCAPVHERLFTVARPDRDAGSGRRLWRAPASRARTASSSSSRRSCMTRASRFGPRLRAAVRVLVPAGARRDLRAARQDRGAARAPRLCRGGGDVLRRVRARPLARRISRKRSRARRTG